MLSTLVAERRSAALAHDAYADTLHNIRFTYLLAQDGSAAKSIESRFETGESHSREVASRSSIKAAAYQRAHDAVRHLREDLQRIAEEGEKKIQAIIASKIPLQNKIDQILGIVAASQAQANSAAALQSNNILDAVQTVLDVQGVETSARAFATQQAVPLEHSFRSVSPETMQPQVEALLNSDAGPPLAPADVSSDHSKASEPGYENNLIERGAGEGSWDNPQDINTHSANLVDRSTTESYSVQSADHATSSRGLTSSAASGSDSTAIPRAAAGTFTTTPSTTTSSAQHTMAPSATILGPATAVNTPTANGAAGEIGSTRIIVDAFDSNPNDLTAPTTRSPIAPPTHPSTESLTTHFPNGALSGAPVSAAAEALISTATSFHAPLAPAPVLPSEVPLVAEGPTLFENAHLAAPGGETPLNAPPAAEATHPVVAPAAAAMPTAPTAPPPIASVPPAPTPPAGLIGYGADLRPTVTPPPPAPAPPATVPGSAPVTPAGGSAGPGQTAVVRQAHATTAPSAPGPAVLTENAIAATTAGAVTGATGARAQAEHRLTRLLHAVARQQPRLRWAVGEHQDGSLVLAADLAGGWIPPNIEIPVGLTLLSPQQRSGSIETLIGPTELTVNYRPGDYLPPGDAEPVAVSIRARDTPVVPDLAWELTQATKWRDGLPRLAHTLATAVFARTGCLDTEVDLLREHLATVSAQVLKGYPESIHRDEVANWQLLATIDALIEGRNTLANYHFAWFRTQTRTPEREAQP